MIPVVLAQLVTFEARRPKSSPGPDFDPLSPSSFLLQPYWLVRGQSVTRTLVGGGLGEGGVLMVRTEEMPFSLMSRFPLRSNRTGKRKRKFLS